MFGLTFGLMSATATFAQNASPSTLKLGKKLFNANCATCHQADAIGKPGFAPSLSNPELLSISSNKFLMGTIRDGREDTGMAPFAHLGRKKVTAIVSYLRSTVKVTDRSKEVDAQPDAQGDPRLGQQWYNYICSTCHGIGGTGYEAGGTGTAIGLSGNLAKSTFLAAASHDVRQLLQAMGMFLSVLNDKLLATPAGKDETIHSLMERLDGSVSVLNGLFASLLDISKLELQTLQPEISVFNVGDLMLRLAGQFESQAQAKGLGFSVDIPDFTVQSDEALLSQILSNFLGNAIRYTDAGKIINLGLS
jgi:mono/diheme cytochrome c family protein